MTFISKTTSYRRSILALLLVIFLSSALVTAVFQATAVQAETHQSTSTTCPDPIYVNQSVTSTAATGISWTDAYTNLKDGLSLARTCVISAESNTIQVWVAAGIYTPTAEYRIPGTGWVSDRDDNYTVTAGIQLYGGFIGTETEQNQRDWETNRVILNGDYDGNQSTVNNLITTTDGLNNAEVYNVIRMVSVTETGRTITNNTVIDGFFITGGRANGSGDGGVGGGLHCNGSGENNECSPTLSNLYFSGNWGFNGGAIYCGALNGGRCQPIINNTIFYGNTAFNGGSIHNQSSEGGISSPIISHSTFRNGRASSNGSSIYNQSDNSTSSPILNNVTFFSNATNGRGGAIYNYSTNGGSSSPIIDGIVVYDNIASEGGVMYNYSAGRNSDEVPSSSTPSIHNAVFFNNTARNAGGAIYNYSQWYASSSPTITNALIYSNTADYGGVFYNYSKKFAYTNPALINVTIYANQGINVGGAFYNIIDSDGNVAPTIVNSVLWQNESLSGSEIYNDKASTSISYSIMLTDSSAIVNESNGDMSYGANVSNDDPLFLDSAGNDTLRGTVDDNYQLGLGSPAIDAGNNDVINGNTTTDLAGNSRIYDETAVADSGNGIAPIVDIGAYEATHSFDPTITLSNTTAQALVWTELGSTCIYGISVMAHPYASLLDTSPYTPVSSPLLLSSVTTDSSGNNYYTVQADCTNVVKQSETIGLFSFSLATGD